MSLIRILLADDHIVMRRGLRLLLESQPSFSVVAEASDGRQAVERAEATRPDVAVLDIAMPNLSGIEAAQRIAAQSPGTAIVILSMHSDEGYVLRALKAGARGYLLKDAAEGDLIEAIQAVTRGKHSSAPRSAKCWWRITSGKSAAGAWKTAMSCSPPASGRSSNCWWKGNSNKDIAASLNVSPHTVETHRRNLQDKLNLHSFAELILYAIRKRIIS